MNYDIEIGLPGITELKTRKARVCVLANHQRIENPGPSAFACSVSILK